MTVVRWEGFGQMIDIGSIIEERDGQRFRVLCREHGDSCDSTWATGAIPPSEFYLNPPSPPGVVFERLDSVE